MDRDPGENHLDPIERETPSTGENDTGDVGDEAARIIKKRRAKGTEPEHGQVPVQTKAVPNP